MIKLTGFKLFIEQEKAANYIDGLERELGISVDEIPEMIETGPVEVDGIFYNQAIWQIIKPIDQSDAFVRIKLWQSNSPNLDQRAYTKKEDGKMVPYEGDPTGKIHIITMDQLAKILGKGWTAAQPSPI